MTPVRKSKVKRSDPEEIPPLEITRKSLKLWLNKKINKKRGCKLRFSKKNFKLILISLNYFQIGNTHPTNSFHWSFTNI